MLVTAIEGVVENGKIHLREDVSLAENTRVYVIVADMHMAPPAHVRTPRLADPKQAGDFHKQVMEIPADAEL
jgi:hypothetical protein